jgi:hypothetical protein
MTQNYNNYFDVIHGKLTIFEFIIIILMLFIFLRPLGFLTAAINYFLKSRW